MKLHQILVIKATCREDHVQIKKACKEANVPFTKYNNSKSVYTIDMTTVPSIAIQRLIVELNNISPINLNMLRNGLDTTTESIFGINKKEGLQGDVPKKMDR